MPADKVVANFAVLEHDKKAAERIVEFLEKRGFLLAENNRGVTLFAVLFPPESNGGVFFNRRGNDDAV